MDLGKLSIVLSEVSSQPGSTVDDLLAVTEERLQLLREVKRLQSRGSNGAPRVRKERKGRKGKLVEVES